MNQKSHILIVDDVVDNIQVAMSILKENNYGFSFATNGKEGLELAKSMPEKFDLILLDIMMPNMNGYEVCEQLKQDEKTRHIPIIFLTAKVDIDSISKGFSLGAVDYITKPFHAEELLARVTNHLHLYHAKRLLQENNLSLTNKLQFSKRRLLSELEQSQQDMIYILTELVEAVSDETGKHIRRISDMSALLAKYHPALTAEDVELIRHASPMHDIGKMMVPQEILHKPGKLTPEEFEVIKTHTTAGYKLLKGSKRRLIQNAATIAHEHHERWAGGGYPRGIEGNDIHLYARIVSVVDVFDALTHKRCYKEAWPIQEAVDYIKSKSGTQFEPELVDIFLEHIDEFIAVVDCPVLSERETTA